jgi:glutamate dehydrogenase (NADP+)
MIELHRHIGAAVDVPAGDIGVGAREIGYMFGQYKRLENQFTGAMTGKGAAYGGSFIRTEATGYGCVYFAREMLATRDEDFEGKRCTVSGSGNVAQYAAQKLIELGATVLTMSDRSGTLYFKDGLTRDRLLELIDLKTYRGGSLDAWSSRNNDVQFLSGRKPWDVPADAAFPCATQNEINARDAQSLLANGCHVVSEGANMPASSEAATIFEDAGILYAPGKAANACGVAISGLEMTQNAIRLFWTRDEVDHRLQEIMRRIHEQCVEYGRHNGCINYVTGANVGGFVKVADAMLAYGIV